MSTLSDELTNDPLARGYAGMTDAQASADLRTEYRTVYDPVDAASLNAWAAGGPMMKILNARDDSLKSDAVRSLCWAAWRMLDRDQSAYNHNNAEHAAMVDALLAAGVLAATDKTALVARAARTVSRAAELGVPANVGDVAAARA